VITAAITLLGSARKLVAGAVALVGRHPWPVAFAAALTFAWWQTGRADQWHRRSELEQASHRETKANFKAAMAEWKRQANAAKVERARLLDKGKETSRDAQTLVDRMSSDNAGLRAYVSAHRLRDAGQPILSFDPAAADRDPAISSDAAAGALVATSESDLDACDAAWVYAAGAHAFAAGLRSRGLAIPATAPTVVP
jgi:hypothetical protein